MGALTWILAHAAFLIVADASQCSKDCASIKLQSGVDFLNTDGQQMHHANSVAECCSICQGIDNCGAFTYRTDQHACWTKSDARNPTANSNAISGSCVKPLKCLGEFAPCIPASPGQKRHCTMGACGACKYGQYLCPSDQKTCIDGPEQYHTCPGLKGTHLDSSLDVETRIQYLIKHSNLTEQIGQLQNKAPAMERFGVPFYNWLNDDQHGVGRTSEKATVFPNGAGLGATWAKELLASAGTVLGLEARGLHNFFLHNESNRGGSCNGCGITIYGPNLNLVKDPRWGRGQETFGEDPHLMARLVVAWVTGAQNNTARHSTDSNGKLLSGLCCKHFAVYNIENIPQQRYMFDANVTAQSMWETYMPAFQACIEEGKATHVMCSYNSVNGVPTCGNKGLLTEILRDQWGFDGFVVSDYDAWANILRTHHYVPTMEDAAATGLNAGMDQEGGGNSAINALAQAIADGKTSAAAVATAFSRLLRVRMRLGMLDPPLSVAYNQLDSRQAQSPEHLAVALRVAQASMTLLKNRNHTLPLSKHSLSRAGSLALIGPQAKMAGLLMGNYAESASKGNWGLSVMEAVSAVVGDSAVVQVDGCADIDCGSDHGFAAAVAASKQAEVVVVMLGLQFGAGRQSRESEGHDRSSIELPGQQGALVSALRAANPTKPIVGLLVHGGTLALGEAGTQLDAIMSAWYPGLAGGQAIASTLFGDYSPAGRSPTTWYRATSDLVAAGDQQENDGSGMTYRYIKDYKNAVVYPFGFGLSYTSFTYSDLSASATSIGPCDPLTLTVRVANTGPRDSDEVVQVYLQLPDASVATTRVRLVAFERVFVKSGASVQVSLEVLADTRAVVYSSADVYHDSRQLEKGRLSLSVGGGQPDYYAGALHETVTVTAAKALNAC